MGQRRLSKGQKLLKFNLTANPIHEKTQFCLIWDIQIRAISEPSRGAHTTQNNFYYSFCINVAKYSAHCVEPS
jgi:hypothetical protein